MENLCEIKEHTFTAPNLTYAKVIKVGKTAVLSVDSASYFNNKNNKDTLLQLPAEFAPTIFLNISANNLEGNFTNFILDETGKFIQSSASETLRSCRSNWCWKNYM